MGVCPTLALSHSLVQFGPTAVGDHSTALLYLTYNQTVRNQSKQRPSAGARLFSFTPPQDSSIRITPAAGRLLPGKVRRGGGGHLSSSGWPLTGTSLMSLIKLFILLCVRIIQSRPTEYVYTFIAVIVAPNILPCIFLQHRNNVI